MKFNTYIFLYFITSCSFLAMGQDIPMSTRQQLEHVAEISANESIQDDGYGKDLIYLKHHPLNLNSASREQLQGLHMLTGLQIDHLLWYRKLTGRLIDIYELQAIPGWDLFTIEGLLPYIMTGDEVSIIEKLKDRLIGDHAFIFTHSRVMEKARGFDTSLKTHYLGNPDRLSLQYNYRFKDLLQIGILGKKDPGEQFFRGAAKQGFDFYSFHLFARKLGLLKDIAIGDYTVNMGQGLIEWQSLGFNKTSEISAIERQASEILPYRSAGEFNFNRGVAVTLKTGKIETTIFGSSKKISTTLNYDSVYYFSSLLTSGLHRTATEISHRNNVQFSSAGGSIDYYSNNFKFGINTMASSFSVPFQKRNAPYNYYSFKGRYLWNSGLDYRLTYKNLHLFGEAAIDKYLHPAFIQGVILSLDQKVDLSLLYRNIPPSYQSISGNSFTESGVPVNEKGCYVNLSFIVSKKWKLSACADIYKYPWLKYRINAPSSGSYYIVQAHYQPEKQMEVLLTYKNENKPAEMNTNDPIPDVSVYSVNTFSACIKSQINRKIRFNSKIEIHKSHTDSSEEFLQYIELSYKIPSHANFTIKGEYFETDPSGSIYTFENSLKGFAAPSVSGKGFRYYFSAEKEIGSKCSFLMNWSQVIYLNKSSIGSGPDLIRGNKKSELQIQLNLNF